MGPWVRGLVELDENKSDEEGQVGHPDYTKVRQGPALLLDRGGRGLKEENGLGGEEDSRGVEELWPVSANIPYIHVLVVVGIQKHCFLLLTG